MKPVRHLATSAAVSGALYTLTGDTELSLASFVSGVLLDVDHIPDYLAQPRRSRSVSDFVQTCLGRQLDRAYLVLHAWELLIGAALLTAFTGYGSIPLGLLAGFLHHMLLDHIGNRVHPFGYSLLWRASKRFDYGAAFPE